MKRVWLVATIAVVLIATALVVATLRRRGEPSNPGPAEADPAGGGATVDAALEKLRAIPFYRATLSVRALRSVTLDRAGALHVRVDVRAAVEPRVAALGVAGLSELLPREANGTIAADGRHESWVFDGPSPLLDLLDRTVVSGPGGPALAAIPGTPSAMARVRLLPSRLADPSLGGAALATFRDRVGFAEKLLGRPLRAEIAEDLAGPAVFALYETSDAKAAEAVVALELKRSDRISGLLDMLFGLGALAERATVRRYRGVATGSFASPSDRPGLALAVDGPILFVATSRAFLESAIDARRDAAGRDTIHSDVSEAASWSASSTSTFVARGWSRLARLQDVPEPPTPATTASLRPEGTSAWRLEGEGPSPAITADPLIPFLRIAFAKRQGDGG